MKPTFTFIFAIICFISTYSALGQTCSGQTFPGITAPSSCTWTYTSSGWVDSLGLPSVTGPTSNGSSESICILVNYTGNFSFQIRGILYVASGAKFSGSITSFSSSSSLKIAGELNLTNTPSISGATITIGASGIVSIPGTFAPGGAATIHNAGALNVGGDFNMGGQNSLTNYSNATVIAQGNSVMNAPFNNCGLFELFGTLTSGGNSGLNNLCSTYIHTNMNLNANYYNEGLIILDGSFLFNGSIFYNNGTLVVNNILLNNDKLIGNHDDSLLIVRNNATLASNGLISGHLYYDMDDQGGFDSVCAGCTEGIDIVYSIYIPTTNNEILANCGGDIIIDPITEKSKLDFDGVDDYVTTPNLIAGTTDVTLMAWVKSDAGNATNMTIAGEDVGCRLWLQSGNKPSFTLKVATTTAKTTSTTAINFNEWHHITGSFSASTGNMKLYVDGVLKSTLNVGATGSVIANSASNGNFEIGRRSTGTGSEYLKGDIDEVRVFNTVLTDDQIQRLVYQEIKNNSGVLKGTVIDKNIVDITTSATIAWTSLKAYYPMDYIISYTRIKDYSTNGRITKLKNITSFQDQTAPMPYETKADGAWTTEGTWLHGDVWDIEDVANNKACSIVKIKHDVSTTGSHNNLGLFVDSTKTLTVNGGNEINNSWYLQIHGKIDLQGESQLVQGIYSELDVTSAGIIEQDQQGTADKFTYNYWSSPVGVSNTTTNNNSYALANVFKDGTNAAAPASISFLGSGYNGSPGPPLKLADYWIWKFANAPSGQYSQWQHTRSTGNIKAGEGFTMKGPGSGNILDNQNYVFQGKPNNGLIELDIAIGNDYLIGNPYPSAIDANQFITDNAAVIVGENAADGTLYFWEHWGGGTHNLSEYQGGYAMYNLAGAVPTASMGSTHPDVGSGGAPTKTPGRYIPVGQGFFVTGNVTGKIKFNNGQRVFHKESSGNSTFMKSSNSKGKNKEVASGAENETRLQIRIGFNSVSTYRRQLLLTEDANATIGVDKLYDARIWDFIPDDMYWVINDQWFGIQGIDEVTTETILPVGIHTVKAGVNTITIDELINVPESLEIYVHDKEEDSYHDLRKSDYQVDLMANTASTDRFKIVLKKQETIVEEEVIVAEEETVAKEDIGGVKPQLHYDNEKGSITFNNPELKKVNSIAIYNVSGQLIKKFNDVPKKNNLELEIKRSPGIYILTAKMENELSISKNILIK